MPAARILSDLRGRAAVPPEPLVVAVPGDGPSAPHWRDAKSALEAAVLAAYGTKRRLHFAEQVAGEAGLRSANDPAPAPAVNAFRTYRVGFDAGWRRPPFSEAASLVEVLRGVLDLHACLVSLPAPQGGAPSPLRISGPCAVALDVESTPGLVELGSGEPDSLRFCEVMAERHGEAFSALRFAQAASVEEEERSRGRAPFGQVMAAVGLRGASPQGARRAATAARRFAEMLGLDRIVFADDAHERPSIAASRRAALAEAVGKDAQASFVRAHSLLGSPEMLATSLVSAPEAEGLRLLQQLSFPLGGLRRAACSRVNFETGHVVVGPWQPGPDTPREAYLEAARLLLLHLGWPEAAAKLAPSAL